MIRKTNAKFREIGRLGIAAVAVLRPDGDRIGAAGRHEEAPRLAVVTGDDDVRAVFTRSGRRREVVAPAASRTEAARRRRRAAEALARRLRSDGTGADGDWLLTGCRTGETRNRSRRLSDGSLRRNRWLRLSDGSLRRNRLDLLRDGFRLANIGVFDVRLRWHCCDGAGDGDLSSCNRRGAHDGPLANSGAEEELLELVLLLGGHQLSGVNGGLGFVLCLLDVPIDQVVDAVREVVVK